MKYRNDPINRFMDNMSVIGRGEFEGNVAMMGEMSRHDDDTSVNFNYATDELKTMFRDWIESMEDDVVTFAADKPCISALDVSSKFNISHESAIFILKRLQSKRRINLELC